MLRAITLSNRAILAITLPHEVHMQPADAHGKMRTMVIVKTDAVGRKKARGDSPNQGTAFFRNEAQNCFRMAADVSNPQIQAQLEA
jgi:hypothetical protein